MRHWILGATAWLVLATTLPAAGQGPLLKQTFDESEEGWQPIGNGVVAVTHELVDLKEGKGALAFTYPIAGGQLAAMIHPVEAGSLAKAKSLQFYIKADYSAPMAVVLQEKGEGRYLAGFLAPAGKWQRVELAPSDFTVMSGADDPKDPDGKLEMEKVEAIGVADLAQIFAQLNAAITAKALGTQTGFHKMVLDELTVSDQPAAPAQTTANGETVLDTFVRPQLSWFGIGMALAPATGAPLDGKGLQATYRQAPGSIAAVVRQIPKGTLAGSGRMLLDVVSSKTATLMVQVEETGGGKYNQNLEVKGTGALEHLTLSFSTFNASNDSKDTNGKLDLDQVQLLIIADLTAFVSQTTADNTLWIGRVRVAK